MKLPIPRDAFSESKQTSRAALIDMAGMLFRHNLFQCRVFAAKAM